MYREGHTFTVIKISKISARGDKNPDNGDRQAGLKSDTGE